MDDREQGYIGEPLNVLDEHAEKTPRQPTELELSYIAGLFDGEGYVCIGYDKEYRTRNDAQSRSEAAAYRLTIGITMTNESIIRWVHGFWGGSNRITKSLIPNANRSTAWHWRMSGKKAEEFLRAVYPFLRVKKHDAALGFKFLKVRQQKIYSASHRADELRLIYTKLRSLHTKGRNNREAVETAHLAPIDVDGMKIQSDLSGDGKSSVGNTAAA